MYAAVVAPLGKRLTNYAKSRRVDGIKKLKTRAVIVCIQSVSTREQSFISFL